MIMDTQNVRSRPKLSLEKFDKKMFPVILQKRLEASPIDLEGLDLLESWYSIVIESAVLSGTVLFDDKGGKNLPKIM